MKTHTFYKEDNGGWFIDLPEYLAQGGSKADLAMVAGADTMLDIVAGGQPHLTITMHTELFKDVDVLNLVRLCEPAMSGGYYYMHQFEGKVVNQEMWLCSVTEFVFGGMPQRIYVKRKK